MARRSLSSQPGTYVLIGQALQCFDVSIGRLGRLNGHRGYYGYVGSAFGSGGLRARIRHHLQPVSRPHWHFDYLHRHMTILQIWYSLDLQPREHLWARLLLDLPGGKTPLKRFGASDCACPTHLIHWSALPSVYRFRRRAHQRIAGQAPISMVLNTSDTVF